MKRFSLIAYLLSASVLINSCSRNPVTGKRQVVFMSEAQELAMGKEADPQIIASFGLYEDSLIQRFIREKGNQMAAISHRPNIEYNFRVVDSEVINAFAVPGGYVYFTRGIMAHFNDEAQFAGVLGHEIGHITARHSVAQQ
ncbi:MAG TPA: M48 family metalloprotease, partial [Segetibacter sp.]